MANLHCTLLLTLAVLAAPRLSAASGIAPPNATVGANLEVIANLTLDDPAPEGGLEVTLTSSDPARLKFSRMPEDAGTATLKLKVRAGYKGSPDYYIQGFAATGTVTYTVTAPGRASGAGTVTLAPSGIIMARSGMGLPGLLTTTGAGKTELLLYSALLDSGMNFVHPQPVAGGRNVIVKVSSSDPKVAAASPGNVVLAGGAASATFDFLPAGAGETSLSVDVPPGFSAPAMFAKVTAHVVAPGMAITDEISIGHNLQTGGTVSLGEAAPSTGLVVTLTSANASKLLLSPAPDQPGTESIQLTVPPGGHSASYYIQALAGEGAATYSAAAPGYRQRTASVSLTPSGLVIGGPQGPPDEAELLVKEIAEGPHGFITNLTAPVHTLVTAYTVQLDPVTRRGADLTVQAVRAGAAIPAVFTNSNPETGALKSMHIRIPGGASSAVNHFTPAAMGTTVIAINTPSGYTKAGNSTSLTVTVRE
ncbi:MAG: hypothetical protein ABI806_03945 [Candidatus Solibacter sp.]